MRQQGRAHGALFDGGGVCCVGARQAVCGLSVQHIVDAIQYAVKIAGVEHVGYGSDFDGTVTVPFDASEMSVLTHALLEAGFSRQDVAAMAGGNVQRVLRALLPSGSK